MARRKAEDLRVSDTSRVGVDGRTVSGTHTFALKVKLDLQER